MNQEILMVAESVSNEKDLPKVRSFFVSKYVWFGVSGRSTWVTNLKDAIVKALTFAKVI